MLNEDIISTDGELVIIDAGSFAKKLTIAKNHEDSAEVFRNQVLEPALKEYGEVTIDFNNVEEYNKSFIDEAFGKLIKDGFDYEELTSKLIIFTKDEVLSKTIWACMERYYVMMNS